VVLADWGERSPSLHAAADIDIRIEPEDGATRTIRVHATPSFARDLGGMEW
jgi:tRNA A37 threonylcarbamoyladenosine biosynthesis protein TsaE